MASKHCYFIKFQILNVQKRTIVVRNRTGLGFLVTIPSRFLFHEFPGLNRVAKSFLVSKRGVLNVKHSLPGIYRVAVFHF